MTAGIKDVARRLCRSATLGPARHGTPFDRVAGVGEWPPWPSRIRPNKGMMV